MAIASVAEVSRLVTGNSDGELLFLCMVNHWWHDVGKGGHLPFLKSRRKVKVIFWKVAPMSDVAVSLQRIESVKL